MVEILRGGREGEGEQREEEGRGEGGERREGGGRGKPGRKGKWETVVSRDNTTRCIIATCISYCTCTYMYMYMNIQYIHGPFGSSIVQLEVCVSCVMVYGTCGYWHEESSGDGLSTRLTQSSQSVQLQGSVTFWRNSIHSTCTCIRTS